MKKKSAFQSDQVPLSLKILAYSLVIDSQCITDFESLYQTVYLWKVNNLILYLAGNWSSITQQGGLPLQLPPTTLTKNLQALNTALSNFVGFANSLLSNKATTKNGQQLGFKNLKVERTAVETALASAHALHKVISRSTPKAANKSNSSFVSSFFKYLLYLLIFSTVIYFLYINKKIPQHWVEEVQQYIPKVVVDAVTKGKKYFG